ncbi:hypothetical protein T07_10993 [Trichinella nelsoni]|uniref:Uncharacterized protein n=1 Tax=Trichinella nelsoni TaxID=6336 RepID=A0A0V0S6V8_9BILA|nr:hypothetical protein T07_10993 [Trichinella nelsoni]
MELLTGWPSARFWRSHIYAKYPRVTQSQLADVNCDRCQKLWTEPHQNSHRFSQAIHPSPLVYTRVAFALNNRHTGHEY